MSTRKVLQEMLENCLGAAYQQEIRNRYQSNVEKDVYGVEEREYDAGIAELTILFSQEKKAQLAEYEKTCSSLREYAARYGCRSKSRYSDFSGLPFAPAGAL